MVRSANEAEGRFDLRKIARDVAAREGFVVDLPPLEGVLEIAHDESDPHVVDERHLLWSSIDNRESTDLDQIEAAERLPNDGIRIKLGIADVDAYVPRGSVLDRHAALNTTSLYAGIATFPMLPDDISSGVTSLLEGAERFAVITEIDVAADGTITASKIYRALVKNHAKLVYDDVGLWLEGRGAAPPELSDANMADQVRMQDVAAQRLRRRRIRPWSARARDGRGAGGREGRRRRRPQAHAEEPRA